jgi:hypothetical protein
VLPSNQTKGQSDSIASGLRLLQPTYFEAAGAAGAGVDAEAELPESLEEEVEEVEGVEDVFASDLLSVVFGLEFP